jgi:hypothetical protein
LVFNWNPAVVGHSVEFSIEDGYVLKLKQNGDEKLLCVVYLRVAKRVGHKYSYHTQTHIYRNTKQPSMWGARLGN